jgi:hypothetical protein
VGRTKDLVSNTKKLAVGKTSCSEFGVTKGSERPGMIDQQSCNSSIDLRFKAMQH